MRFQETSIKGLAIVSKFLQKHRVVQTFSTKRCSFLHHRNGKRNRVEKNGNIFDLFGIVKSAVKFQNESYEGISLRFLRFFKRRFF